MSIHYDEQTPHMHLTVVTGDERGKLNCKAFYGQPFMLRKLQDDFAEMTNKQGYHLKRGMTNSKHQHYTIRDFNRIIRQSEMLAHDALMEEYKISVSKKVYFQAITQSQKMIMKNI